MKSIKDIKGIDALFLNHFKIWFPHITAHKLQLITTLFAKVSEKA